MQRPALLRRMPESFDVEAGPLGPVDLGALFRWPLDLHEKFTKYDKQTRGGGAWARLVDSLHHGVRAFTQYSGQYECSCQGHRAGEP